MIWVRSWRTKGVVHLAVFKLMRSEWVTLCRRPVGDWLEVSRPRGFRLCARCKADLDWRLRFVGLEVAKKGVADGVDKE